MCFGVGGSFFFVIVFVFGSLFFRGVELLWRGEDSEGFEVKGVVLIENKVFNYSFFIY